MSGTVHRARRLAAGGLVVLGALVALLLPVIGAPPTTGLLAAVLTVALVAALTVHAPVIPQLSAQSAARHALRRLVVRPAQSDPDARGHARPRAPGRPTTAV